MAIEAVFDIVFALGRLAYLLCYLFVELVKFIFAKVFDPWKKERSDVPLPFRFSLAETLGVLQAILIFSLPVNVLLKPTRETAWQYGIATVAAVASWAYAIYTLNGHCVTDVKRRYVTCSVTFPMGVLSIVGTLSGLTFIIVLFFSERKTAMMVAGAVSAASISAIFFVRKLSQWALCPMQFIDLTDELRATDDPQSSDL